MTLKDLRKEKGLTQKALADASGMNISQIQKLESGETSIENTTFKNGLKLAEVLGVTPIELITASQKPSSS